MTVMDGPLQKAVVCLDRNINGLCDTDEPSAITDALGNASIPVPNAELGLYPIVAMVGTDAIDADTGPVLTAYTLKAPPDATEVVSPLTTMVQTQRESTGASTADAAAAIQSQLGLTASPLANFTQDSSAGGQLAATLARLIVVTTQTQQNDTRGALGVDGKPLTSTQINNVINIQLLQQLQTLATAVLDNPVLSDPSKSIADKQSAMQTAAQQVAATTGLNSSTIGLVVASQTPSTTPEPATPTDTTNLRWFWFQNGSNFYIRAFEATAAQNTPDAQGKRYFTEYRENVSNGSTIAWVRPNIYWTGTEWFDCPTSFVNEVVISSSTGESASLYCKTLRSIAKQNVRDISGLSMRTIVQEIRSAPMQDSSEGSFANWGTDPANIPATATWPSGSTLAYRNVRDLGGADYYSRNNLATIPSAAQPDNPDPSTWHSASLADFVAWNAGDFAPNVSAAQVNGNNSRVLVGRRDYLKPDGSKAYKRYMVGFESGGEQRARFYECEGDMSTLAMTPPRNGTLFVNGVSTCKAILVSNYSISDQGGAKVLRFSSEPTQLNATNFQTYRIFVEANGITHVGFKDKESTSFQQRLNKPAAEALLAALGLD
jgi:hypothetical protein